MSIRPNAATLYELAAVRGDQRILIAYSDRKSRAALHKCLAKRAEHVARVLGVTEFTFARRAADGASSGEWRFIWTGRTQRDAHAKQILPYIGDVASPRPEQS